MEGARAYSQEDLDPALSEELAAKRHACFDFDALDPDSEGEQLGHIEAEVCAAALPPADPADAALQRELGCGQAERLDSVGRVLLLQPRELQSAPHGQDLVPPASKLSSFQRARIFGPHHSCTNALARELTRAFDVSVEISANSDDELWKHRVFTRENPPPIEQDVLCICMVKDPAFWIQSLARDPSGGTFYDIQPISPEVDLDKALANEYGPDCLQAVLPEAPHEVQRRRKLRVLLRACEALQEFDMDGDRIVPNSAWSPVLRKLSAQEGGRLAGSLSKYVEDVGGGRFSYMPLVKMLQQDIVVRPPRVSGCCTPREVGQLFRPVLFDGAIYEDALHLWEVTVGSYFDEAIFPPAQTVVLRCEDLLFSYTCAVSALCARGLPLAQSAAPKPVERPAKALGHPACTADRSRSELLAYYSDSRQRFRGLNAAQLSRLSSLDPLLVGPLGYGKDAVAAWSCKGDSW